MSHGEETLRQAPSFREFRAMHDAAENSVDEKYRLECRFLLTIMGKLGLRPGEASHISKEWSDLDEKVIEIPGFDKCTKGKDGGVCGYCRDRAQSAANHNDDLTFEEAKEQRWQPANEQAQREVPYDWLDDGGQVIEEFFSENEEYTPSRSSINRRVDRVAEAAPMIEVTEVNPKALRGHAAIKLANEGLSVIKLRDLLGYDGYKIPIKILEQVSPESQTGFEEIGSKRLLSESVSKVPNEPSEFEEGTHYHRSDIHREFGGERFQSVSSSTEYPSIFLFMGEDKDDGHDIEFKEDGTLYCTILQDSDHPEWADNIEAITGHREAGESLFVFESMVDHGAVSYVGEFEYVSHFSKNAVNGDDSEKFRIELSPANHGPTDVTRGDVDQLTVEELHEKALENGANSEEHEITRLMESRITRSEIVKRYALRVADGVCQGCGEEAPFDGVDGEPFLEVHHLHRQSDGGPDHPDNVIALCPNCHRRVHYGKDGDEFNEELIDNPPGAERV